MNNEFSILFLGLSLATECVHTFASYNSVSDALPSNLSQGRYVMFVL